MKALSLWQPHAQAIALGLKTFETRHWSTNYRGLLAIHAAKRGWNDDDAWHADARRKLKKRMEVYGAFGMSYGAVVCVVELVDCVPTSQLRGKIGLDAEFWGDFSDGVDGRGRYAFQLANLHVLPEPVSIRGIQGLFDVELDGFHPRPSGNLSLFGEGA